MIWDDSQRGMNKEIRIGDRDCIRILPFGRKDAGRDRSIKDESKRSSNRKSRTFKHTSRDAIRTNGRVRRKIKKKVKDLFS